MITPRSYSRCASYCLSQLFYFKPVGLQHLTKAHYLYALYFLNIFSAHLLFSFLSMTAQVQALLISVLSHPDKPTSAVLPMYFYKEN